jgi:hypothetical protein
MKKLILASLLLAACNATPSKPVNRFNVSQIPDGIKLYGFTEKYSPAAGQYELLFYIKNETGKKIEYPQVDGQLYVKGVVDGSPTGGPGKNLEPLDSGVVSLSWILPEQRPDSVLFTFAQM